MDETTESATESVEAPPAGSDGSRKPLIDWANAQDSWVRDLAKRVIETRAPLSETDASEVYDLLLAEKRLSETPFTSTDKLTLEAVGASDGSTLKLVKLDRIAGVNALVEGGTLEFDSNLTVLHGQNGTGKTGYSRVIKRAAAVRSAEEILGNVDTSDAATVPSASVSYELDGTEYTEAWQNELGLGSLRRVSVFDAQAASFHVDEDLNYVFTPAELSLYSYCSESLQAIRGRLDREIEALAARPRGLLDHFERGTEVYAIVESLGASTDVAELARLSDVEPTADTELEQLQAEVAGLARGNLEAHQAATAAALTSAKSVRGAFERVAAFSPSTYQEALGELVESRRSAEQLQQTLFSDGLMPHSPDEAWRNFIGSADDYRQHLVSEGHTDVHSHCIYCNQSLGEDAKELIDRYRRVLSDQSTARVEQAQRRLTEVSLTVPDAVLTRASEGLTALGESSAAPGWVGASANLLDDSRTVRDRVADGRSLDESTNLQTAKELVGEIQATIEELETKARELDEQRSAATQLRSKKQQEANELKDRIELSKRVDELRQLVLDAKRAERLSQVAREVSSRIAPALTRASTAASEDLVNRSFEQYFDEECAALGAKKVSLGFQGRRGRAERTKTVGRHRPSAVLSEGEQKVLALADFLAECRMNDGAAPIVFDDPVTSLDYRRLTEVAERISRLAETNQVVVFTHNVMFASAILANRQQKSRRVKFVEVREQSENVKGLLVPDVEPNLDTAKDIAKRVNQAIQHAENADPAAQDALIGHAYDLMRSWCEAFAEQELLAGVSQRYRANVRMTVLNKIRVDRLTDAVGVLQPMFEKICRFIPGHSNPFEQSNVKPTVADLKNDWSALTEMRARYLAS